MGSEVPDGVGDPLSPEVLGSEMHPLPGPFSTIMWPSFSSVLEHGSEVRKWSVLLSIGTDARKSNSTPADQGVTIPADLQANQTLRTSMSVLLLYSGELRESEIFGKWDN